MNCEWHDGFDATEGCEACLALELSDPIISQPVRKPGPRQKSISDEIQLCHACQAPGLPTIRELKLNYQFTELCYDHPMEKTETGSLFNLIACTSSSSSVYMFEH